MLDQVTKPAQQLDSPPEHLMKELDSVRLGSIGQAAKPQADASTKKTEASSIELSNPFKSAAEAKSDAKPADSKTSGKDDAGKAGADTAADKAKNAADKTDKTPTHFDNSNILDAMEASRKTGLPLVVEIGQSWCPHCQKMEKEVLPLIEGTADKAGSLQGKAIYLHIDYDKSKSLQGDAQDVAGFLRDQIQGFPTFRVFNVSPTKDVEFKGQTMGELSQADLEKFLNTSGVK